MRSRTAAILRLLPHPLLSAFALLWLVALGACLPRPCETATNCQRDCECTQNGVTFSCPAFFLCVEGTCEADYNKSCDEICTDFLGRCGSQRCDDETDCDRNVTCNVQDQVTGAVSSFNCEKRYLCENGLCEEAFNVDDNTLCNECAFGGGSTP